MPNICTAYMKIDIDCNKMLCENIFTVKFRAGHFRYFLIFSITKVIFFILKLLINNDYNYLHV